MRQAERQRLEAEGWSIIGSKPLFLTRYPTYGNWGAFIKSHPAHVIVETIESDAPWIEHAEPYMVCIGCGAKVYQHLRRGVYGWHLFDIKVGALICIEEDEPTGDREVTLKWKLQPAVKRGMGCEECFNRYVEAERATEMENRQREAQNERNRMLLELHRKAGIKMAARPKMLSMLQPFLDLTETVKETPSDYVEPKPAALTALMPTNARERIEVVAGTSRSEALLGDILNRMLPTIDGYNGCCVWPQHRVENIASAFKTAAHIGRWILRQRGDAA